MNYKSTLKLVVVIFFMGLNYMGIAQKNASLIKTEDIRIRDPFIFADKNTKTYYMYAQMDNRLGFIGEEDKIKGVEVYSSADLKNWTQPHKVLELPENSWGRSMVWAPEVHFYKNKYYQCHHSSYGFY